MYRYGWMIALLVMGCDDEGGSDVAPAGLYDVFESEQTPCDAEAWGPCPECDTWGGRILLTRWGEALDDIRLTRCPPEAYGCNVQMPAGTEDAPIFDAAWDEDADGCQRVERHRWLDLDGEGHVTLRTVTRRSAVVEACPYALVEPATCRRERLRMRFIGQW